jgi:16S rRNA (adenine1518-N6/adenine1519-N6)-dimethyltransferase
VAAALLGPADIRKLAERLDVRPTKTLGQNFLHDANTIRRIVRTAALEPGETVLEVGPGLGSLTLGLIDAGHPVIAIEIDPVLAAALPDTVATRAPGARVDVVQTDALRFDGVFPEAAPTALVANLPYNVGVPVVLHLLDVVPTLRHGLVLVQAEVAERLAAPPGSRAYGVPSVKLAWYATANRAGGVSRSVFWPVPNVDSGLVRLVRRPPPATFATRQQVFAAIDAAFAQRRKTLRAALAGWAGSAAAAEALLVSAGIDPSARGETLDVGAFSRLAELRAAVEQARH